MSIAIPIALVLLFVVLAASLRQHFKYLAIRRERVDDRQPLLYSSSAFHAVTFLKLGADRQVMDEVRALKEEIEKPGGGTVIYAGQVAMRLVTSEQIGNDWDALVMAQYPSRKEFHAFTETAGYREVLARFSDVYTHGAIRSAGINLLLPLGLLAMRVSDILQRKPSILPYEPVGDDAMPKLRTLMKEAEQFNQYRHIREDAVVVYNLIKPGNKEQQKADRAYSAAMISSMAEGSFGPMHMGKAVTVEGDAEFKNFAVVFYPGIDHMQAMIGSSYMNRIGAGKQLGDSLAVATIPILSML